MGDLDGGISDGVRSIELDPKLYTCWYVLGPARGGEEIHDGAIADLDRTVKLNPRER